MTTSSNNSRKVQQNKMKVSNLLALEGHEEQAEKPLCLGCLKTLINQAFRATKRYFNGMTKQFEISYAQG